MRVRDELLPAAIAALLALTVSANAQSKSGSLRLRSTMQMQFDCERPRVVKNYGVRATFRAVPKPDNSATADLGIVGFFLNTNVHFDTKLGRDWIAAPGGTSQLRVLANNRLRGIWSLPNNDLILDMTFNGPSCTAALAMKLKPGRREYSMYGGTKFYYCSAARVVSASCEAK